MSFPGKLTVLLHGRYQAGGAGLTVLPCELISANGEALRAVVTLLAARWYGDQGFADWLDHHVLFCNTLVDRIVSEPLQPAGAVAEPYALWVIERRAGQVLPCRHPMIVLADAIEPYAQLKLFILNLGHSFLAHRWIEAGRTEGETVRGLMAEPQSRAALLALYANEVIPGFARQGMAAAADAYVTETLQRFDNPFLDHRLADIAENHGEKIRRRLQGFVDWSGGSGATLDAVIAATAAAG